MTVVQTHRPPPPPPLGSNRPPAWRMIGLTRQVARRHRTPFQRTLSRWTLPKWTLRSSPDAARVRRGAGCILLFGLMIGCDAEPDVPIGQKPDLTVSERSDAERSGVDQAKSPQSPSGDVGGSATSISFSQVQRDLRRGHLESAQRWLEHRGEEDLWAASNQQSRRFVTVLESVGRLEASRGLLFQAIGRLEKILSVAPDRHTSRRDLIGLLAQVGLMRRAEPHLQYLTMRSESGLSELIMLSEIRRPQADESMCKTAVRMHPSDRRPLLGIAVVRAHEGNWSEACDVLRSMDLLSRPEQLPEATALLGRALLEQSVSSAGQDEEVARWRSVVDSIADLRQQPDFWFAQAMHSESLGDSTDAMNAYTRAVELDPNDAEALTRLATIATETGRRGIADAAGRRSTSLNTMRQHVDTLLTRSRDDGSAAMKTAGQMRQLHRPWEAAAWAKVAAQMPGADRRAAVALFKEVRSELNGQTPFMLAEAREVVRLAKLSREPAATDRPSDLGDAVVQTDITADHYPRSTVRFEDEASARGVRHVGRLPSRNEPGMLITESNGPGVGIGDFDCDGWPDLFWTHIDGIPGRRTSSGGEFYRSLDGQFRDETRDAGLSDPRFTQGIAVGDLNGDGFPDLVLGHFDENSVWINRGDGTFGGGGAEFESAMGYWTTGLAIADVNGDGIADVVEVNYCDGDNVLSERCVSETLNEPRACSPLAFAAAPDRLWLGDERGNLRPVVLNQPSSPAGRGLGLVVGELDGGDGSEIYVANDMTANQFWTRNIPGDESPVVDAAASRAGTAHGPASLIKTGAMKTAAVERWVETAGVRGLAFNRRSLSQASMGIAADDADADGDLDFYVSNFTDDYNTAYLQATAGRWSDRTEALNLVRPTFDRLGYGTQWIDADNDGVLELFVANGHVDDFTHNGNAFRMPPQLFRRQPGGQFAAIDASEAGDFLEIEGLGRAVASGDLDRDGRVDMAVSQLLGPSQLLMNRSDLPDPVSGGRALELVLVGRTCDRDAIGTVVTATSKRRRDVTGWRLAGSGFQCANEAVVRLSGWSADEPIELKIRWPNGESQTLDVPTAGRWICVEGLPPFQDVVSR